MTAKQLAIYDMHKMGINTSYLYMQKEILEDCRMRLNDCVSMTYKSPDFRHFNKKSLKELD